MTSFITKAAGSLAAVAFIAASAYAQAPAPAAGGDGPPVLASKLAPARGGSLRLLVTSNNFSSSTELDDKYTQNGDNMSPSISWPKGPPGTQSYAVLAEDASVDRKDPIVHWIIYNIPGTSRGIPQNLPTDATLENGAEQGKNIRGSAGYIGPKPPAGQTHTYHFQVFALNGKLDLEPANADRATVLAAMKNKVVAQGDLVVNYTGK
jgi:Raf kinase inhibitor-like YbhB/YbcL family protein